MIHDIVNNSLEKPDIRMSEDVEFAFRGMRKYMFENVYTNPKAKGEEEKAENILKELFRYYMDHPERLSNEYIERMWQTGETQERSVCDYIAGMHRSVCHRKVPGVLCPGLLEVLTMSFYSQELVEEIRSRNDIVDVVSSYVKLQRKGSNYVGVCPFHNDHSPSMSVNQPRQIYHCFSCGAGGDVF